MEDRNNKLEENIEKLIEFSKFENNWDGYNGVKISTNVIKKLKILLKIWFIKSIFFR